MMEPAAHTLLPGPLLTRAWDRGLIDAPGDADVIHALSLATPPARHAALVVGAATSLFMFPILGIAAILILRGVRKRGREIG